MLDTIADYTRLKGVSQSIQCSIKALTGPVWGKMPSPAHLVFEVIRGCTPSLKQAVVIHCDSLLHSGDFIQEDTRSPERLMLRRFCHFCSWTCNLIPRMDSWHSDTALTDLAAGEFIQPCAYLESVQKTQDAINSRINQSR